MSKLNSSESKILDQIAGWKAQSPSFLNKASEFVSKPITWLTAKLIPDDIQGGISGVTENIVEKLHDVSQWSVNPQDILEASREFDIQATTIEALKKASIHDLDHISDKFISQNTRMGTISGAGTGLIGWPGLIADLPTLFSLSLRSIYQIAMCYGYNANDPGLSEEEQGFESEYMMRIFKIATASDKVQKQRSLAELKDFEAGRYDEIMGDIAGDYASRQVGKNATSFVSQRIIREIVEQTLSKKAAALVPGLGAIFNAGFNYVYLNDVGEAAFMLYRERFLLDKKGRRRSIVVKID